jgi:hypothetical protein
MDIAHAVAALEDFVGAEHPLKFFNSGRALSSVLS